MDDPIGGVVDTDELTRLFDQNYLLIIVIGVLLLLMYARAGRIVAATVPRTLEARSGELEDDGVQALELEKRTETISALALTLIRLTAVSGLILIFIGVFQLWSLLTVAALFLAAVTLAGQSIVLDYLMGLYIVLEGTFFKGDNIKFGEFAGDVEDVGLRRTVIRGPDGTVHSISNGELRSVSNRTRIFAAAEVRVRGIREEDLDAVIDVAERVAAELAKDPAYAKDIIEPHTLRFMEDNDELGEQARFLPEACEQLASQPSATDTTSTADP